VIFLDTSISGSSALVCRLQPYEEALGQLKNVQLLEGYALAEIGPVTVALPIEIGERLNSFIGQRIGVLRTEVDYRYSVMVPKPKIQVGSNFVGTEVKPAKVEAI
jgi:hypothetical protein